MKKISLDEKSPDNMRRVVVALLLGRAYCWVGPTARRRPSTCRRSQQPAAVDETAAPDRPLTLSTIDRARTVAAAAVSTGGSLSTLCRSNGEPFGSFVDYVLDAEGMPVTLLAEQSEHTLNLKASPSASLMLQMPRSSAPSARDAPPPAALSRVTLQGRVVPIDDNDELLSLKTAFAVQHAYSERLLESPRFTLSKIQIERVYYVGGFGVSSEWVDVGAYSLATPDMLAGESASLVAKLNSASQRADLDLLCTQFLKIDDAADGDVRVQSVDRLGLDVRVTYDRQQRTKQFRVGFQTKVTNVEDAKSEIAKIMQEAWESAQGYWGPEDGMGPEVLLVGEDILN